MEWTVCVEMLIKEIEWKPIHSWLGALFKYVGLRIWFGSGSEPRYVDPSFDSPDPDPTLKEICQIEEPSISSRSGSRFEQNLDQYLF